MQKSGKHSWALIQGLKMKRYKLSHFEMLKLQGNSTNVIWGY